MQSRDDRSGVLAALGAYLLWGFFPLYFPLLEPAGAMEILAHRICWTLVVCVLLLVLLRRRMTPVALTRRQVLMLAVAAVLLGVNWLVYITAVNSEHVVEAALGYFVTPLVGVMLGVVVLHERLRTAAWVAVAIAVVAVLVLTASTGRPPWIALSLAATFGTYALLKKQVGAAPLPALTVEAAVLTPAALIYLLVLTLTGGATFTGHGFDHVAWLISAGFVTTVPLLLFGAGANRVRLSIMGLLQYVTPVVQFSIGIGLRHEHMPALRWAGFALIWVALAVFSADALLRRPRAPATHHVPSASRS